MPLEPKKPIDELLEASATARRAAFGADPKMPDPMRTQLHHEISRLTRKDECESRWRAFGISWPRLMTATALALVLVSASAIWWWRGHQSGGETMKLAMQQPMAPANEAAAPEKVFEQGAAAAGARSGEGFAENKTGAVQSANQPKVADALGKLAEAAVTPSPLAPGTKDISAGKKTDGSLSSDISLAAKETNQSAPAAASLAQNRQTTNFRQQFSKNASDQAFRSKPKQTLNIFRWSKPITKFGCLMEMDPLIRAGSNRWPRTMRAASSTKNETMQRRHRAHLPALMTKRRRPTSSSIFVPPGTTAV